MYGYSVFVLRAKIEFGGGGTSVNPLNGRRDVVDSNSAGVGGIYVFVEIVEIEDKGGIMTLEKSRALFKPATAVHT